MSETRWVDISHRSVRIGPLSNRTNEGIIRVDDLGFLCAHHNHQVRHTKVCHFAHVCGRHVDSSSHNATFGTHVWAARRLTKSQFNIWYTCVDDSVIHRVATQHLVHVCGRHVDPPGHNATFGTGVRTTRRFTRSQINICYKCVDDNSNCKLSERTCHNEVCHIPEINIAHFPSPQEEPQNVTLSFLGRGAQCKPKTQPRSRPLQFRICKTHAAWEIPTLRFVIAHAAWATDRKHSKS